MDLVNLARVDEARTINADKFACAHVVLTTTGKLPPAV